MRSPGPEAQHAPEAWLGPFPVSPAIFRATCWQSFCGGHGNPICKHNSCRTGTDSYVVERKSSSWVDVLDEAGFIQALFMARSSLQRKLAWLERIRTKAEVWRVRKGFVSVYIALLFLAWWEGTQCPRHGCLERFICYEASEAQCSHDGVLMDSYAL